jgi:hypothetical protein
MPTPTTKGLRAIVATVLVAFGVVLLALFRIVSGTQHQAYSIGAVPPAAAHVTAANTYHLSVRGGVKALIKRGLDVGTAQCEWSVDGSAKQALTVTASGRSTKATNVVATFVAPYTGNIRVDCTGWGAMYIDDADDTPADVSGWFLVAGTVLLAVGVALGLSAIRLARDGSAVTSAGEDDEIERLVHSVHVRSQDREVGPADGDDVLH